MFCKEKYLRGSTTGFSIDASRRSGARGNKSLNNKATRRGGTRGYEYEEQGKEHGCDAMRCDANEVKRHIDGLASA